MKRFLVLIVTFFTYFNPAIADYQAGIAKINITPTEPIWMAGYASRTKPSEGQIHDLYAKAVCLDDGYGHILLILTSDLIGLTRSISESVSSQVTAKTGIPRESILLTASHTHSGPVLRENLADMYNLTPKQNQVVQNYTDKLKGQLISVLVEAYRKREPANLFFSEGDAAFAINRRQPNKNGVAIGLNPDGPVDHRVPVLKIQSAKTEKLMGVVFGYACHNTTLDINLLNGDYAGFAQIELEKEYPGSIAMFWTGCGGDANPNPRRLIEHAEKHGKFLAIAVEAVLKKEMQPITGTFQSRYETISLDFDTLPTKAQLMTDQQSKNFAVKTRASRLLKEWQTSGKLPQSYAHYPVQTMKLGNELRWVALGGEVVIDYALRLRRDYSGKVKLWVAGYANDVMAYIPSERILHEGGYEAETSMIYYGMPSKWSLSIENRIVDTTLKQLQELNKSR